MAAEGLEPRVAYQVIHDELSLDGFSLLNLATFVTTWMEPEATAADQRNARQEHDRQGRVPADGGDREALREHPGGPVARTRRRGGSRHLDGRLERGLHAGRNGDEAGAGAHASSAAGKPHGPPEPGDGSQHPDLLAQVLSLLGCGGARGDGEGDRFTLNAEEAAKLVDENTIGVVVIMGSTMDGRYEPVAEVSKALDAVQKEHGWDIPIHVDGASGGFVAPFIQPDLEWDFRVPRVQSINTSGHKYGLVYPGVGWVVFRDRDALPEELVFHVKYLGGDMLDISINFSRSGSQVIGQYYNFLRLGREGYRSIQQASQDVALFLSGEIAKMGPFELITKGDDLPVFCWKMDEAYAKSASFSLYDLADKLRERGWLVPAYPMPKNREDLVVQRIVVKEDFSRELAERMLEDLRRAVEYFESQPGHKAKVDGSHFHH